MHYKGLFQNNIKLYSIFSHKVKTIKVEQPVKSGFVVFIEKYTDDTYSDAYYSNANQHSNDDHF